MSNEITVHSTLNINRDDATGFMRYLSRQTSYQEDMTGCLGPVPGAMTVTPTGTNVDLSELTTPGRIEIYNLEGTSGTTIEWGVWDGVSYFPVGEIRAGKKDGFRLSRNLGEESGTSGTGTINTDVNYLRIRALTGATAKIFVAAFDD